MPFLTETRGLLVIIGLLMFRFTMERILSLLSLLSHIMYIFGDADKDTTCFMRPNKRMEEICVLESRSHRIPLGHSKTSAPHLYLSLFFLSFFLFSLFSLSLLLSLTLIISLHVRQLLHDHWSQDVRCTRWTNISILGIRFWPDLDKRVRFI